MSANDYIEINKRTFEVRHKDIESEDGTFVGKGASLEDAIEIAERYMNKQEKEMPYIVEYGIHFVGEQCFCKSYFDDSGELKDCTCGKCGKKKLDSIIFPTFTGGNTDAIAAGLNELVRKVNEIIGKINK